MVTEGVTNWLLLLSELGVPDAASFAAKAVDRGFKTPQRNEFMQALAQVGYPSLKDFFEKFGKRTDRDLGAWLGFPHQRVNKYRHRAEELAGHA